MSKSEQWSLKYRPKNLEEFVSDRDTHVIERMAKSSQAILIHGQSGAGKTTLSRIIATSLHGREKSPSLIEINAAEATGIQEIRDLQSRLTYKPVDNVWVVIYDEAHKSTSAASSAMLKLLEDPPSKNCLFILCTDQPWRLSNPMVNRCRQYEIKLPELDTLTDYLVTVAKKEGFTHPKIKTICKKIARTTGCVPRMALQTLQNLAEEKDLSEKDLSEISVIISSTTEELDRLTGRIFIALYSKDISPEERIEFILKAIQKCDAFALITRLLTGNYYGSTYMYGGEFDWRGKIFVEALKAKDLKPSLADTMHVSKEFVRLRESLKEVTVEPTIAIGTALANLCVSLPSKSSK
jgi:DNA polymerase III delta prime subunit